MSQKHWVTVTAFSREHIWALRQQDFELFRGTVKQRSPHQWTVDGLLTPAQMKMLTQQGYRVFVRQTNTHASTIQRWRSASLERLDDIATQGYLTVDAIDKAMDLLVQTYPHLCELTALPHPTHEKRTSRMLRVGLRSTNTSHVAAPSHPFETVPTIPEHTKTSAPSAKPGLLLLGGAHARELVNPDLLLFWVRELCQAYTSQQGRSWGGFRIDAQDIRSVVEQLDLFVMPLVNPDGRAYVQAPEGHAMWRKNRNPNPGMVCEGVDINRNFDFLWSSGIGTSDNSCSDVFRGTSAFSEPETKNVQHLLHTLPNLRCVVDVHSYSELIMYPWGDDDNQSSQPHMNFQNTAYDGIRGILGDDRYREYIPQQDLNWYLATGKRIQTAIQATRGREYTLGPSSQLYPTTATAGDYPYARSRTQEKQSPLYSLTIETGREFQPPLEEAQQIIQEVSSGLFALALAVLSS